MVYKVSSRTARAIQRNLVSKNQKKKKKKKKKKFTYFNTTHHKFQKLIYTSEKMLCR
jgi:hypothetical protein